MVVQDRTCCRGLRSPPRRRGERGGAISLWTLLMVPVSAFAAVVAMAGPQRLAAESSVQEAAEDLSMLAVAWRDGQQNPEGTMPAFPPDCAARTPEQRAEFDTENNNIAALDPDDPDILTQVQEIDVRLDYLLGDFGWLPEFEPPPATPAELRARFDQAVGLLKEWEEACAVLFEALVRDLGYLGVEMGSLRGSFSDSLNSSYLSKWVCSDTAYTTRKDCTANRGRWAPQTGDQFALPCRTSAFTDGAAVVVHDAVHVALTADWQDAGWAAAQVWPDGIEMAAESTGRFTQRASEWTPPQPECNQQLVLLDIEGRPVWAGSDAQPDSRELAQSVRRTTVSG